MSLITSFNPCRARKISPQRSHCYYVVKSPSRACLTWTRRRVSSKAPRTGWDPQKSHHGRGRRPLRIERRRGAAASSRGGGRARRRPHQRRRRRRGAGGPARQMDRWRLWNYRARQRSHLRSENGRGLSRDHRHLSANAARGRRAGAPLDKNTKTGAAARVPDARDGVDARRADAPVLRPLRRRRRYEHRAAAGRAAICFRRASSSPRSTRRRASRRSSRMRRREPRCRIRESRCSTAP